MNMAETGFSDGELDPETAETGAGSTSRQMIYTRSVAQFKKNTQTTKNQNSKSFQFFPSNKVPNTRNKPMPANKFKIERH
jgi:hypothetical protein